MQKIYFIRHGQRNDRIPGSPLSQAGVEEAKKTALYLKNLIEEKKVELLASPISRAQETASEIAKQLDLQIETVDWLSINSRLPEGKNSRDDFLKLISGKTTDLILVSHSQTIRNFLGKLFLGTDDLVNILDVDFRTCSVSIVEIENKKFILKKLAETTHLQ